jgi:hypothetical protein
VRVTELRFSTNSDHHAVKKHCPGVLCLDNAFALIDGHPAQRTLWGNLTPGGVSYRAAGG